MLSIIQDLYYKFKIYILHLTLIEEVKKSHIGTVKVLVRCNNNINVKDQDNYTPLHYAVIENNLKIIELLLNHGADINTPGKYNRTALIWAVRYGHKEIVKILLKYNADINAEDKDGYTALHWAAKYAHMEIIVMLLNTNIDIDARDEDGYTALMWAAKYGYTKIVDKLLNKNADINAKNKYGHTALELAAENKNIKTVELLIFYGAQEIEIKDCCYDKLQKMLETPHIASEILRNPDLDYIIYETKKHTTKQLLYKNLFARINNIYDPELVLNNKFIKQLQFHRRTADEEQQQIIESIKESIANFIIAGTTIKTDGKLNKQAKDYIIKFAIKYIIYTTNDGIPNKYHKDPQEYFKIMAEANPFIKEELIEFFNKQLENSYKDLVIIFDNINNILQKYNIFIDNGYLFPKSVKLLATIKMWQQKKAFTMQDQDIIDKYQNNPIEFLSTIIDNVDGFIKPILENTIIYSTFNINKIKELQIYQDILKIDLNILEVLKPLFDGSLKIIKTKKQKSYINDLKDTFEMLDEYYDLLYEYFQLLQYEKEHDKDYNSDSLNHEKELDKAYNYYNCPAEKVESEIQNLQIEILNFSNSFEGNDIYAESCL